ncbi:TetR family transcriptional regulator [Streptomyces sp. SID1034]|uniref:TetR family transcriptional regulator n=1 Tax=Streptomyces sp. SID1034 TaxID=2690248 RepID=UPI00136AECC9|nr:TetR family transcriptional regulator [Streptomyces sp. SID1034]MYV89299.1 TetR family transcriptional regulator [Streptomyces sp. SID1034]
MARTSGPETREKLIRAAEEVFAAQGVDGAQLRDIVRLAGQSNPSAVQYHFGSRAGLLDAVMTGRQRRTEGVLEALLAERVQAQGPHDPHGPEDPHGPHGPLYRAGPPGPRDLPLLLAALVDAEASELRTGRGRRCLRISAQLSHESGVRTRTPHPTLAGTAYWHLIGRIEDCLAESLPEPVRLERIDLALTLVGAAMADRARQYLAGTEPLTGEDLFRADLVATTNALLTAAPPVTTTPKDTR